MSGVFVTYKGQKKFRDNWEETFLRDKKRLDEVRRQWDEMPDSNPEPVVEEEG